MEANEAQELQEHAEHAEHEKTLRPVAFTMSLLAVLVAVTTVQAHKIRANDTALAADILSVVTIADKDAAKKIAKGYADHQEKWTENLKDEQAKAEALEGKVEQAEARAVRFDLAEALLEIGLVITSVTLLTRSRAYWYMGIVFSAIGIASAVSVLFLK
jgi:hypothetical protein